MNCTFCEITEIKARTIVENELAWAFPTNIPIVPGHILVVPKRCVANYDQLSANEWQAIDDLIRKLKIALKKTFDAEGFNFAWNEGKMFGQSVPHFHLHIVPRKTGDTGIYNYEPRQFLYRPGERETSPEEELSETAKLIRNNL